MYIPFLILLVLTPQISHAITATKNLQQFESDFQSDQVITPLYLSETFYGESEQQMQYFTISLMGKSLAQNDSLTISLLGATPTFTSILVNVVSSSMIKDIYQHLPTTANNSITCNDFQINTCVILEPQEESIVLVGLLIKDPIQYMLEVQLKEIVNLDIPTQQQLEFSLQSQQGFSKVFRIDLSGIQQDQNDTLADEIMIKVSYQSQTVQSYHRFTMRAGTLNLSANSISYKYIGQSLGAYSQVLKLFGPNPQSQSDSILQPYYLVITTQIPVTLSLGIIQPSIQVSISEPLQYLYQVQYQGTIDQIEQFYFDTNTYAETLSKPNSPDNVSKSMNLGIYIQKLSSPPSTITISACQFLYYLTSQFGESSYISLPINKLLCIDNNIYIGLHNITEELALRIIIESYQQDTKTGSQSDQEMLYWGEERVRAGISTINSKVKDSDCIVYAIQPIIYDQHYERIILRYFINQPSKINMKLNTCSAKENSQQISCNSMALTLSQQNQPNYLTYIAKNSEIASIKICPSGPSLLSSSYLQNFYSVLAIPYPKTKMIQTLDTEFNQVINSNELILYSIDTSKVQLKMGQQSKIYVKVAIINGNIGFYGNCQLPNIEQGTTDMNDVSDWCTSGQDDEARNSAQYTIGDSDSTGENQDFIIFGIQGLSQSLISVSCYVENPPQPDPPGPTPEPFDSQLSDGLNSIPTNPFVSSNISSLTYSYSSHILPYNLTPSYELSEFFCTQIFTSLQQLQTSEQICDPDQQKLQQTQKFIQDVVYVRISLLDGADIQQIPNEVGLTVQVPRLTLKASQNIMLTCSKFCYTQIKVNSFDGQENTFVTSIGDGFLNSTPNTQKSQLSFSNPPYIFTATIPQGGSLYIQTGEDLPILFQTGEAEGKKINNDYQLDKDDQIQFIYNLQKQDSFGSVLINSFGSRLSADWNVYVVNTTQQNIISYLFPNGSGQTQKYPPQSYSLTATVLNFQNPTSIPVSCSLPLIKCLITVTVTSADSDFFNDDSDIQISANISTYYLYINQPSIIETGYGVIYFSPFVLMGPQTSQEDDGLKLNNRATIQPLSQCATLQAKIVDSDIFINPGLDNSQYLQTLTTQPCVYSISISTCQISSLFNGITKKIKVSSLSKTQLLFALPQKSPSLSISIFKNFTSSTAYPPLLLQAYSISAYNCSSRSAELLTESLLLPQSQKIQSSIYQNNKMSKKTTIRIKDAEIQSQLVVISISIPDSWHNAQNDSYELFIIADADGQDRQIQSVILPNNDPIPVIFWDSLQQGIYAEAYQYFSNSNDWKLCYAIQSSTDTQGDLTISVFDSYGRLLQKSIGLSSSTGCLVIGSRTSNLAITNYSIKLVLTQSSPSVQSLPQVWLHTSEYLHAIQINHAHSVLHESSPIVPITTINGKFGKCYNFDLTSFSNAADVVFYMDTPKNFDIGKVVIDSEGNQIVHEIYVPGTKLKYNITQILSSRNGSILGYKVRVAVGLFSQQSITICIQTNHGFSMTILQQISNFRILINEQQSYYKTSHLMKLLPLQIFRFLSFAPISRSPSATSQKSIVTEIIQCSNSSKNSLILLGAHSIVDIVLGNVAQFQQTFSSYSVQAGLSVVKKQPSENDTDWDGTTDKFYSGVKSSTDDILYGIKMYLIEGSQLPQKKWSLVGTQIKSTLSLDRKDLIVQLPRAYNLLKQSQAANITYTIYILNNQNASALENQKSLIRCPSPITMAQSLDYKAIFNVSSVNPTIPQFKLPLSSLPSLNLSIIARATIVEKQGAMPFNFYYNLNKFQINEEEGGTQSTGLGGKFNIVVLFLIGTVAIFLVICIRVVTKIIKRRSANQVQFEQSPATGNQTREQTRQPQPQPMQLKEIPSRPNTTSPENNNAGNSRAQNRNLGYGQFVDEQEISV